MSQMIHESLSTAFQPLGQIHRGKSIPSTLQLNMTHHHLRLRPNWRSKLPCSSLLEKANATFTISILIKGSTHAARLTRVREGFKCWIQAPVASGPGSLIAAKGVTIKQRQSQWQELSASIMMP